MGPQATAVHVGRMYSTFYYSVLYSKLLFYTVLNIALLYCTQHCCTILYSTLYCTLLFCNIPLFTLLNTVLYSSLLFSTLYYTLGTVLRSCKNPVHASMVYLIILSTVLYSTVAKFDMALLDLSIFFYCFLIKFKFQPFI